MAEELLALLRERGMTLATAESCTGGALSARIVSVSGASEVFLGGVVSYATRVKEALLGVSPDSVARHSVVSREVAREMAEGARRTLSASLAVSTTGYAGPNGEDVGLVYIGVSGPLGTVAHEERFSGSREAIRAAATDAALRRLMEYLRAGTDLSDTDGKD